MGIERPSRPKVPARFFFMEAGFRAIDTDCDYQNPTFKKSQSGSESRDKKTIYNPDPQH